MFIVHITNLQLCFIKTKWAVKVKLETRTKVKN